MIDSSNPRNNSSPRNWNIIDSSSTNSDFDDDNVDPMLFDNDSSISSGPDVENTVIDNDNKYGVICYRSDDANP